MKALAVLNAVVVALTVVNISYARRIKQDVNNEGIGGGLFDVDGPAGGYFGQMEPGARAGYDTPRIDYGIGPVRGGGSFAGNYQGGGDLTNLGSYGPGFIGGQFGGPMGGGANLGTVAGIDEDGDRGILSTSSQRRRPGVLGTNGLELSGVNSRERRREERERRREERRRLREERRRLREEKRRERLERRRFGSRRSDSEEDLVATRREKATLGLSAINAGLSAVNTVGTLGALGRLGAFGGAATPSGNLIGGKCKIGSQFSKGNNVGGGLGGDMLRGNRCTTCN